jgi:hypothetical protein
MIEARYRQDAGRVDFMVGHKDPTGADNTTWSAENLPVGNSDVAPQIIMNFKITTHADANKNLNLLEFEHILSPKT